MTPTPRPSDSADRPSTDSPSTDPPSAGSPSIVVIEPSRLAAQCRAWRTVGESVAYLPSRGRLHEGHRALVRRARERADRVVLATFLDPLEFSSRMTFRSAPRTPHEDRNRAEEWSVDALFAPEIETMYADEVPVVRIDPCAMGRRLRRSVRVPREQTTDLRGTLTGLARQFGIARPELVMYSRLEFREAALVRRMGRDLAMGFEVELGPLVREHDGLAVSPRNRHLSPVQRGTAPRLHEALVEAAGAFAEGEADPEVLTEGVRRRLERRGGFVLDFVEVVDPLGLESVDEARPGHLIAAAIFLGAHRLVDNVILGAAPVDPRLPRPSTTRSA